MNKRKFDILQSSLRSSNPWAIENHLQPVDKAFLMLLSAVYEQAIEEIRRTHSVTGDAARFIRSDPYGYLTDDLKKAIFEGVQNESKRDL